MNPKPKTKPLIFLIPILLSAFLVALWLPSVGALAAGQSSGQRGTFGPAAPNGLFAPAAQVTETEVITYYLGEPLELDMRDSYGYCYDKGSYVQLISVWDAQYTVEENNLAGVLAFNYEEWGKVYNLGTGQDGWRWSFGICEGGTGMPGNEPCTNIGIDIVDGTTAGSDNYTTPLYWSSDYLSLDGTTRTGNEVLELVHFDSYVRKTATGWPLYTGVVTGTTVYLSMRYEFDASTTEDCSGTSGSGEHPLPLTFYPIYYGSPPICETCVTEDDLLSSGTAGETPAEITTEISATYFIVGDPGLGVSLDGGETYLSLGAAGETCGPLEDDEASVYVTAAAETMYLVNGTYAVYDASCLSDGVRTCEDYYEINYDTCRAGTIDSKSNAGEALPAPLYTAWQTGLSYYFETQPPPYLTETSPPVIRGIAELTSNFDGLPPDWYTAENFAQCVISDTVYSQVFFDFQDGESWGVRATDTNANYMDNSGDLSYIICQADYTPPPPACEDNFELIDLFKAGTINANSSNGYYLRSFDSITGIDQCMNANTWYSIETKPGPWYDCNLGICVQYTDIQISEDNGENWEDLTEWGKASCVVPLANDYVRVYFKTGELPSGQTDACNWKVRVDDVNGEWSLNQLSVDYEVWSVQSATGVITPPISGGDCSDWTLGDLVLSGEVDSELEQGERFPNPSETGYQLEPGQWYALETDELPWLASATQESYLAGLTSDGLLPEGIRTYYELSDYPGAACVQTIDEVYTRIYFRISDENRFALRYRAQDTYDTSYLNNTGDSFFNLYSATFTGVNPPPCGNQYTFTRVGDGSIPAQLYSGVSEGILETIEAGGLYRIDTAGGPWDTGDGSASYDVDISSDGGATWDSLSAWGGSECMNDLGGGYVSVIFEAAEGANYALRVSDGDESANYPPNLGAMRYILYKTEDSTLPPPGTDPIPPGPPPVDPGAGCNVVCYMGAAPIWTGASIVDFQAHAAYLGDWLSYVAEYIGYARCNFSRYIAWCPYHTEVIMGMDDLFQRKEPYGTIYEFINTYEAIKAEIDSYNWTGSGVSAEYGGEAQTIDSVITGERSAPVLEPPQNFFLAPAPTPTASISGTEITQPVAHYLPWDSGSIWSGDEFEFEETETYLTTCENAMADSLGPILSPGVCYATNALEAAGLNTWFNWIISGSFLMALAFYVKNKWIDPSFESGG